MQREVAGIANPAPMVNLVAVEMCLLDTLKGKKNHDSQISHQTGAQLTTLPVHIMELMNWLRQANPVQIMYRQVPVFHASNSRANKQNHDSFIQMIYLVYATEGG